MNNLAVFRCNASPIGGTGHVMRCMALAEELSKNGFEIVFAVTGESRKTVPALDARGWRVIEVSSLRSEEQADEIHRLLGQRVAVLVVDDYQLGAEFERNARKQSDLVAVIEDMADRPHDCDVLINSNSGLSETLYRPHVPENCRILLGPQFAPLRPEFAELREMALQRRLQNAERVLVSFGGSDPANGTGLALAALKKIPGIKIDVAIGAASTFFLQLQKEFGSVAAFHVGTNDMARLMCAADLAIGGGGSTAWERAALGLPAVIVTIADNQRNIAQALDQAGAAVDLGDIRSVDAGTLQNAVEELLRNADKRNRMSRAAAKLTDGHGSRRIAVAFSGSEKQEDGSLVRLRCAEPEDSSLVLHWQRQPGARTFSRNPDAPDDEEHARWFKSAVNDSKRIFAIVLCNEEPCGFVRLDQKNTGLYEVSLLVSQEFRGRGIGVAALKLIRKCAPAAALDAFILPENKASVAAFAKAGYTHAAADRMRSVPA